MAWENRVDEPWGMTGQRKVGPFVIKLCKRINWCHDTSLTYALLMSNKQYRKMYCIYVRIFFEPTSKWFPNNRIFTFLPTDSTMVTMITINAARQNQEKQTFPICVGSWESLCENFLLIKAQSIKYRYKNRSVGFAIFVK